MNTPPDLRPAMARIEIMVEEIERAGDVPARERSRALVQALLDVHGAALGRLLELCAARDGGPALIDELAGDEAVALLFSLHGLHARDLDRRLRDAVDALAQQLGEEGVALALDAVADDRVRVRVSAAGAAPVPASDERIRELVETSLSRAIPELADIEIDGLDSAGVVNITLGPRKGA